MPTQFSATIQPASDMSKLPSSQVVICRHKPDGTYLEASDAAEAVLGYKPAELIGRQAYDLFHPDDVKTIAETHHRAALLEGIDQSIIYRVRQKNGDYRVIETITITQRDRHGLPTELVTHSIRVT